MNKILEVFKKRGIKFYIACIAEILMIAWVAIYGISSSLSEHPDYSTQPILIIISVVSILLFIALSIFEATYSTGPAILFVGQILCFAILIKSTVFYLSDKFFEVNNFGGFVSTLQNVNIGYILSIIIILVIFVLSTISLFMKQKSEVAYRKENPKFVKTLKPILKISTYVLCFLTVLVVIGGNTALDNAGSINSELGIQTEFKVEDEKQSTKDSIYFKSKYKDFRGEVCEEGYKYAQTAVEEGAVLLKNENNALPLGKHNRVSLFSASCVFPSYSGYGSGAEIEQITAGNQLFKTEFEEAGLEVNEELFSWYTKNTKYCRYNSGSAKQDVDFSIADANWSQITTSAKTDENYGDAAIFILARAGGEDKDLTMARSDHSDMVEGDYLRLNNNEIDVLKHLSEEKEKGTFLRLIVIVNSASQVCGLDNPDFDIDAILWTGSIGSKGCLAIGNILLGKVNPSGRLSGLFWTRHSENPANINFDINNKYKNPPASTSVKNGIMDQRYVVYQEGIYIGYRYAETRYEDVVMKQGNAGDFDYYDVVDAPFGYGLSYTTFSYSNFKIKYNEKLDSYNLSVTVTNTGKEAGKEVVQFYLSKPYTNYDKQNKIEKPSVELVGYGKTKLLAKGESQEISVDVDRREFASYDAYKKGTYILEKGNYYFAVGKDSHDAINSILKAKGVPESKLSAKGNTTKGNEAFTKSINIANDDYEIYSKSKNGTQIVNQFDNTDILLFEEDSVNAENFEYLSRADWVSTYPKKFVQLTRTDKMNKEYDKSLVDAFQPTDTRTDFPKYGIDKGISLIDLRAFNDGDDDPTNDEPIPYDHEDWDDFLNQITWEETVELLRSDQRNTPGLARLGKPATLDHNGCCGVKIYTGKSDIKLASDEDIKNQNEWRINYPCNCVIGSTFNDEFTQAMGVQWGEEALWAGYSGLYGPGANLFRSAYNGRTYEYYSEDPVLTGYQVSALSKGCSEKGLALYLKHCILNEKEAYRHGINTWANEQTIRELYLKAFQIAIEVGECEGVMTGFNFLGVVWCVAQGFCQSVLHGEFGMRGLAISDWYQAKYMYLPAGILGGNDIPDGDADKSILNAWKGKSPDLEWAMRESVHRMMYQTVQSNAMNGVTSNTKYIHIEPAWKIAIEIGKIVSISILSISAIGLGVMMYFDYKNKYFA